MKGYSPEKASDTITSLKEYLDLAKYSDKKAKKLSGGCKRKLCFAMAMASEPRLVLLDEPTCGLDPLSRRELYAFLKQSGTSVVIVTQSLDDTEEACDLVGIMNRGRFLQMNKPQILVQQHSEGHLLIIDVNQAHVFSQYDDIYHEQDEILSEDNDELDKHKRHLLRVKHSVSEEVKHKMPFCVPLLRPETIPVKYRNCLHQERLLIFNFNSMDKFHSDTSFAQAEMGSATGQKIWHVFHECMQLQGEGLIREFQIEKASLDQVYEKLIH